MRAMRDGILADYPTVQFDTMALKLIDRLVQVTETIRQIQFYVRNLRMPVIKRHKRVIPAVMELQKLTETESRLMLQLRAYADQAIRRPARPVTLEHYVAKTYDRKADAPTS